MIKIVKGNIFNSSADCLVNTVNCVGYMGKGIALEMSIRYPGLEKEYKEKCERNEIEIGKLWLYDAKDGTQKILNFPTKIDFKYPTKPEYLKMGLDYFRNNYKAYSIKSIAFPMLGAQNGKLDKDISLKFMKEALNDLQDLDVEIYIFDKDNFKRDKLIVDFLNYVHTNRANLKYERIDNILASNPNLLTFADMTEKKISEEKDDGTYQRRPIATKRFLQNTLTAMRNRVDEPPSLLDKLFPA